MSVNPLLVPSTLPYGLPPFDLIKEEHYAPAFEMAFKQSHAELEAIANNTEAPTFENTIVAMEKSDALLNYVNAAFSPMRTSYLTAGLKAIEESVDKRSTQLQDARFFNEKLFARIKAVYEQRASLNLDSESLRLLEETFTQYSQRGALLSPEDKAKLAAINQAESQLQTQLSQNMVSERTAKAIYISDVSELEGVSAEQLQTMAADAVASGKPGFYKIKIVNTTTQPILGTLKNRALRTKIKEAALAKNNEQSGFDNTGLAHRLVAVRAQKAKLLGKQHYADLQIQSEMAQNAATVNEFLAKIAAGARKLALKEAADNQRILEQEVPGATLTSADWEYCASKVQSERFGFDEEELKPYFEFESVLQNGLFYTAKELFGLTFKERKDLPSYSNDVRTFEVFDSQEQPMALFIIDAYAREGLKRGGAWMDNIIRQNNLLGQKPVITNNLNLVKPAAGAATLMTLDDVTTAFHEFGHGLHGMLSKVQYPTMSGTCVARDFVELPSQLHEMWALEPAVLNNYARHHQTGERMPAEFVQKVLAARCFNQGHDTSAYLGSAFIDQAWHQLAPEAVPAKEKWAEFEAQAIAKAGLNIPAIEPRYRTTYFAHAFEWGYAAAYYSYIWAEVLDANASEYILANGGLSRKMGAHLQETILSRGNSQPPQVQFMNFLGKHPSVEALLRKRGLVEEIGH